MACEPLGLVEFDRLNWSESGVSGTARRGVSCRAAASSIWRRRSLLDCSLCRLSEEESALFRVLYHLIVA